MSETNQKLVEAIEKPTFQDKYKLTDLDLSYLWELFMEYGMTRGEAEHRTKGNHYFLQGICQYHSIEWKTWKSKLSTQVKELIKTKYPQLMVQDKSFEKN